MNFSYVRAASSAISHLTNLQNAPQQSVLTPDRTHISPNVGGDLRTFFFLFAAIFLSIALYTSSGFLNLMALFYLFISFFLCLCAIIPLPLPWIKTTSKHLIAPLLLVGVMMQFWQLLVQLISEDFLPVSHDVLWFGFLMSIAAVLAGFLYKTNDRAMRLAFAGILVAHFCIGFWSLHWTIPPRIDVYVIQRDSVEELLKGLNPYQMTYPNIYGDNSPVYAKGLSVNGRLTFGYVYWPLTLLMAIPGYLLGDVRYSNLFCVLASGALIGFARPGRIAFLAATLFLFTSQIFYVEYNSWTDTYVIFWFSLLLFVATRAPRWNFLPLGLLLAVKQYLFLAAPLIVLLVPRAIKQIKSQRESGSNEMRSLLLKAIVVALAVSLPLVLWNTQAFVANAIMLNFKMPFRPDSLNFVSFYAVMTGVQLSSLLGFALLIPTYFLVLKRCPATPAGFAGAFAILYFVFFLFGRQAFINYYIVIFAALCWAVALWQPENELQDSITNALPRST